MKQPTLLLYRNIENASEIRKKIVEASLECAVLKPRFIIDPFQVQLAVQLALYSQQNQSMKTRSVHSEIIYNMSPNKKITDSLKTFGIGDQDEDALFVIIEERNVEIVKAAVQGKLDDISNIGLLTQEKEIRKIYKIKETELEVGSLLEAVVNRISTKEIITF